MNFSILFKKILKNAFVFVISLCLFILSGQALAVDDIAPPSVPQNLTITANTDSTVSLSWNFSIDNFPNPISYTIYTDGGASGSTTSTVFTVTNLKPLTNYSFTVKASDAAGNFSDSSNALLADTTEDRVAPKVIITYPLNNSSVDGLVNLSASSTDDILLTGVQFVLDDQNIGDLQTVAPFQTAFNAGNYAAGSAHKLKVLAYDSSGNIGTATVNFSADKAYAAAPLGIQTTNITSNSATIIWQTTTGVLGSIKYGLSSDYTWQIQESAPTTVHSIKISGLESNKTYNYMVTSSSAGYTNATSTNITFTTLEAGATPIQPPTPTTAASTGQHPDGTLVLDGSTVYLIKNNGRAAFRDEAEYKSFGYNFSQAVPISETDKSLTQNGVLKAMEGTLVLDKSDGKTVYMVGTGGTKRGFASAQVFFGLGYVFKDLASVNMNDYQAGPAVDSAAAAHPDGALVLDNKTVWWIRGNTKQGFESEAVFNTYGFSFSKIVPANAADLQLPQGPNVKFRDGTLVKDGNDYYIISNAKKLKFTSTTQLTEKGYKTSNALNANLSAYESGGEVN